MSIESIITFMNNNTMLLLLIILTSLPAVYFIIDGIRTSFAPSNGAQFP